MNDFDHSVKKWLQDAKICRNCGTLMDCMAGGIYGEYKSDGVNEGYIEFRCPKCNLKLKEVTKREWTGKEFKILNTPKN